MSILSPLFPFLTISSKGEDVIPLRGRATRRLVLSELRALSILSPSCSPCSSEPSELSMLLYRGTDPIDPRISADGLVRGVHHNDLKELIGGILIDPIGVEYSQIPTSPPSPLLGLGPQRSLPLQLIDPLGGWLPIHNPLGIGSLPPSPSHSHPIDHKALLGLVPQPPGLIGTRGPRCSMDSS